MANLLLLVQTFLPKLFQDFDNLGTYSSNELTHKQIHWPKNFRLRYPAGKLISGQMKCLGGE